MPKKASSKKRTVQVGLQILLIAGISVIFVAAHYSTTTHAAHFHDIYRRILYIPIIFAGFWFGLPGALITSVLLTIAYVPHIYQDWGGDVFGMNLNRTLEVVMYNVVALITGWFSQRLRRERDSLAKAHRDLTEKTRQIFEAEEQLRRADRLSALGKLSAGLAHEIRNPLGSIRGTAEILSDKFQPGDEEHEFFQILQSEVARLNQVLTNFLEFARGEKGEATTSNTSCSMREIVNAVGDLLSREFQKRNVDLDTTLADGDDSVAIPRDHLNQVVLNLLLNALQSVPDGGKIEVGGEICDGRYALTIGDSGPGIPEEIREEIFQPFFTTREGGTGLGLPMVQKILASHGATLELGNSRLGGAEFKIDSPLVGSQSA